MARTRTRNIYANDGLFVSPGQADASLFMNPSGNLTNGPVKFWREVGICPTEWSDGGGALISGINNIFGKNNVYKFTANSANSTHLLNKTNLLDSLGFYGLGGKLLIPSSNTVKSVAMYVGDSMAATTFTNTDKWISFYAEGQYVSSNQFAMFLGTDANPYIGNGTDSFYFKDVACYVTSGEPHINLTQQINRIQSINASVPLEREKLLAIGATNIINDFAESPSDISLGFEYLLSNLSNEQKLGFNVNFPSYFNGQSGSAFYSGFNYNILNGFYDKSLTGIATGLNTGVKYPYKYQNKKNFYLNSGPQSQDLKDESSNALNVYDTSTYAFGGCYLKSYSINASVGTLPTAKASYICENFQSDLNWRGPSPSLYQSTRDYPTGTGKYYMLPLFSGEGLPLSSVILPQEINISINNIFYSTNSIPDLGLDISSPIIQGFGLDLSLDREKISSIGYSLPLDRPIIPPILANLSINGFVADYQEGNLYDIYNNDKLFNIEINCNNVCQLFTGLDSYLTNPIRISLLGAQFTELQFGESVQNRKTFTLSFQQEVDIDRTDGGLFMSGITWGRKLIPISTGTFINNRQRSIDFVYVSGGNTYINGNY